MKRGTGRKGEHLYPAFPYSSYSLLKTSDVRDLFAYMQTLPAVAKPTAPHQLKFPFNIRLAVGGWKLLYFRPHEFKPDPTQSDALEPRRLSRRGPGSLRRMPYARATCLGGVEAGKDVCRRAQP